MRLLCADDAQQIFVIYKAACAHLNSLPKDCKSSSRHRSSFFIRASNTPAALLPPSSPITPKPSYSELAGCTPPTRWKITKAISLSTIRQGCTKPAAYMTMEFLFRKFPYSALNLPIPLPRAQAKKLGCISYINHPKTAGHGPAAIFSACIQRAESHARVNRDLLFTIVSALRAKIYSGFNAYPKSSSSAVPTWEWPRRFRLQLKSRVMAWSRASAKASLEPAAWRTPPKLSPGETFFRVMCAISVHFASATYSEFLLQPIVH